MNRTNTLLYDVTERNLNTFKNHANIHLVRQNNAVDKYKIRLGGGATIGGVRESGNSCVMYFFDNYTNQMRFSNKQNATIDKIRNIAQDVKSEKIRNWIDRVPKYYTNHAQTYRGRRSTRIFQPIDLSKGEYWEILSKEVNGRIITGYKRINIYSGESDRWQYKIAC